MNIQEIILKYALQYGVDPNLALRVAEVESGFNPQAKSPKGAIGVMQLMPATAKMLGVNPFNVEQNIEGGIRYLKQLLDQFKGRVELALAAYNAGPNAVLKAGGIPNYPETQQYVQKVLGAIPGGRGEQFPGLEIFGMQQPASTAVKNDKIRYFPGFGEEIQQTIPQSAPPPDEGKRGYFPGITGDVGYDTSQPTVQKPDMPQTKRPINVEKVTSEKPKSFIQSLFKNLEYGLANIGKGMIQPYYALKELWLALTDPQEREKFAKERLAEEKAWEETYQPGIPEKLLQLTGEILPSLFLTGGIGTTAKIAATRLPQYANILSKLINMPRTATGSAAIGAGTSLLTPSYEEDYFMDKLKQGALGALLGYFLTVIPRRMANIKTPIASAEKIDALEDVMRRTGINLEPGEISGNTLQKMVSGLVRLSPFSREVQKKQIALNKYIASNIFDDVTIKSNLENKIAKSFNDEVLKFKQLVKEKLDNKSFLSLEDVRNFKNNIIGGAYNKLDESLLQYKSIPIKQLGEIEGIPVSDVFRYIINRFKSVNATPPNTIKRISLILKMGDATISGPELNTLVTQLKNRIRNTKDPVRRAVYEETLEIMRSFYPKELLPIKDELSKAYKIMSILDDPKVISGKGNIRFYDLIEKLDAERVLSPTYSDIYKLRNFYQWFDTEKPMTERGIGTLALTALATALHLATVLHMINYVTKRYGPYMTYKTLKEPMRTFLPLASAITGGHVASGLLD